MTKYVRLLFHVAVLASCASAFIGMARGSGIERYFAQIGDFTFVKRLEVSNLDRIGELSGFDKEFLSEAGVVSLSRWSIQDHSGRSLQADVYESADSRGAYALFNWWPVRHGLEGRELPLAVGNLYSPSQTVFWNGPFFWMLQGIEGNWQAEDVGAFVTTVVKAVNLENHLPVSVSHLPAESLVPGTTRYYCGPATLAQNELFPKELIPVLRREEEFEVAFARYQPGGSALFLIGFPTVALAREGLVELQDTLGEVFSPQGIYLKRSGVLVAVFLGPQSAAEAVLGNVQYKPTIQWLRDERPELTNEQITFLGLVARAIIGTGALVMGILALGGAAGLFRYWLLGRFPNLFRRDEMIRLDLE
ncbi:MAG: hypothetical protein Kow00109_11460 [Acidobacteriota bacterium]